MAGLELGYDRTCHGHTEAGLAHEAQRCPLVGPFLHPKPYPEQPVVSFQLPDTITTAAGLTEAHAEILKAVADGELAVTLARDLSTILETQRRLVETADLEARISKLEARTGQ